MIRTAAGRVGLLGATLALASCLPDPAEPGEGAKIVPKGSAPALTTTSWINNTGPVTWDALQGKTILIEKWATW